MQRWKATVSYRTRKGAALQDLFFEEFEELGAMIEHGPCWSTIVGITVTLNRPLADDPELPRTLEDESEARAKAGVKLH
jgi:hypothetical protein